jgi:predicted dehydrogenase
MGLHMNRIRWGVLSTARIGTEKVIPALQRSELGEVVAIASRDLHRARAAAQGLAIPVVHGCYEDLLADERIDAIYNPLPNHLHVEWSVRALDAGKHVLCEKPIALNPAQARELLAAARRRPQLKVMEAFMYRHHPQWQAAREIVAGGELGELRTIQSFFSYFNDDPTNIRNQAGIGGGALMDIGCYNVSLSRFLFAAEPQRVLGLVERDPLFGTDRMTSGVLEFANGSSIFTCATQLAPYQRVNVFGTKGRLEIEIPFNAPPERECRAWKQLGASIEEVRFAACDQYRLQADRFARAILDDSPVPTPLDDAVANMQVIEALLHSAADQRWMELKGADAVQATE